MTLLLAVSFALRSVWVVLYPK